MWDFPDNAEIQAIARAIYQQGGYLSSVCHGIAGLLQLKIQKVSLWLPVKVTGFTTAEESVGSEERHYHF